jgi:hypothetical protein
MYAAEALALLGRPDQAARILHPLAAAPPGNGSTGLDGSNCLDGSSGRGRAPAIGAIGLPPAREGLTWRGPMAPMAAALEQELAVTWSRGAPPPLPTVAPTRVPTVHSLC